MRAPALALTTLATVVLVLCASRAEALKFDPVDPKLLPKGVKSALWVRDCGKQGFPDRNCAESESSFFQGDAERLTRELTGKNYDEIWLASGGGDLDEGIGIGEVLRRFQATVRVPPGHQCVSSCTVAFLGGVFRYLDEVGTYEVHAASRFLRQDANGELMKGMLADPEKNLSQWSSLIFLGANMQSGRFRGARELAQTLFLHCQKALHPLGVLPPGREAQNRQHLQGLLRSTPRLVYPESREFADDVARVRREGVPAVQEILMRIERDSMQRSLEEIRGLLPSLGPRAEPALRMVETMYSSRITSTALLSRQTLVQMGYVTELFDPTQ